MKNRDNWGIPHFQINPRTDMKWQINKEQNSDAQCAANVAVAYPAWYKGPRFEVGKCQSPPAHDTGRDFFGCPAPPPQVHPSSAIGPAQVIRHQFQP